MFYPMAMNQTTPFRHARTNRNRVSRGSGISCCPSDFTHFSTAWLYRFDPLEAVGSACRPTRWLGGETVKHDPCRTALERVVKELEIWCKRWGPHAYHDPTISLRLIASNARAALEAAPAPVVGDDDLRGVFYDHCDYDDDASWIESEQFIVAARAVLAKYGTTPAKELQ